ncbi:MAG: DUF2961 domain-containing protein [Candidatus Marinimicrobia bacterium]|jgi:hypothetical protein|nr:DUF2961 domain-containing protein [Candidatus Neomarinimicrobiota bacterium]MBT3502826.1 DUF2961 domain-containing protein [Candidatus Neomarinimicrobiota bacterium]MBT3838668.1 DUF2961 domain-containing protein [Candidatus Neomarinimicrobiota bacterium]MBT4000228.1 DUF2961 domain-containing protein [Candidatus Neomarinimicrobiota bacterium]MBT4283667.1 DUF2961 domain-containing protein [Candidatus Neomarinimicrobiota bacterium]
MIQKTIKTQKIILFNQLINFLKCDKNDIYYSFFIIILLCLPINNLDAQSNFGGNYSHLGQLTIPSNNKSKRVSSTALDYNSNGDSKEIMPGETLILADLEGPGIIKHIWNTSASVNPFSTRSLILRIYWDESEKPSVEVPLGDFFGVGHGAKKDFQSFPVSISSHGRSRTSFWEMPFNKHAKITVTNESLEFGLVFFYYYVDWEKVETLPEETLYFHARYHQQSPAKPGDHVILDTKGKGNYVGTVYSVQQVKAGWFGEGDDRFFINDEKVPSIQGTGTEDYFGDAWGFREFSGPFQGVSLYEGSLAGDRVSAYRWHIMDPIRFQSSLKFSMEHRGSIIDEKGNQISSSGERKDWISSVAFWYQTPITFSKNEIVSAKKRIPPYQILLASNLKVHATPNKLKTESVAVFFEPETPNGEITFEFDVSTSGQYKISAVLVDGIFGCRYQPFIDNISAGPELDMVSKSENWKPYNFGLFNLKQGKHELKLVGKGPSPMIRASLTKKFAIGISSLILLRIEDL